MVALNTYNHDNKFETRKVNWTGPGFSGMTNPTPYHPIDEQSYLPMMKKAVNWTAPYETYGQYPVQWPVQWTNNTTCPPFYQQEFPLPSHAGWSKDFVKQQCMTPMHLQYGCPPEVYNCTYDYPLTKDIKWPVPQPTPVPFGVPVPVPMPIQGQWPQQPWTQPQQPWTQPQQQWTQPQQQWPQGQWPQQPMWPQQQWPLQWQEQQPMHLNYQQPMIHPYGPTGLRQMPINKW